MLCSKCAKVVREDAHFCMECGQPVTTAPPTSSIKTAKHSQSKPRTAIWIFALAVLMVIGLAVFSNGTGVQGLREKFVAAPHMETIHENTFSINARGFTSNKFTIPAGASSVSVAGHFGVKAATGNEIEVYVLNDDAFVTWRNGYSTSTYYDSGKVLQGDIHATLPDGAGTYYLVFSNNFSVRTAKVVQADVTLQYSRWAPDWFYRMEEGF